MLCELEPVFEGASRWLEWSAPAWWWSGWCIVGLSFALFRQWSPRYFVHLGWAWTDYRLLLQSRGDFTAPWYSGWMQNTMAGAALALGLAGMAGRRHMEAPDPWTVSRLLMLWWVVMLMRWSIARLWEGISAGEIPGREWALGHRYLLEASAWILAPIGLCLTAWGPDASGAGMWLFAAVWAVGWGVRHQRTFIRISRFRHRPVEGFFYLCALEFLPVAVLYRAWQW